MGPEAKRVKPYSQPLALKELAAMLKAAEVGDFDAFQRMLASPDSPLGSDFYRQPNEALLMEALLMLVSIYKGTGRSMAGYAAQLANNFSRDNTLAAAGIYVPKPFRD